MAFVRCVVLAVLLCMALLRSCQSSSGDEPETKLSAAAPETDPPRLGVIPLNSRTFDSSIRDGNVWLVEFYAEWCGHCMHFASSYEQVAQTFHEQPALSSGTKQKRHVKVAKIEGDKERAISSRFGIAGFPMFFILDGYEVYEYDGKRSAADLIAFAQGGYKKQQPIPFLTSPLGPLGLLQGYLMSVGGTAMDVFDWLTVEKGLSPLMAGGVFCAGGMAVSVVSMIALTVLVTPKLKDD